MTKAEAIAMLKRIQEPEAWEPQINQAAFEALDMAIKALSQESSEDVISRQAAIDAFLTELTERERKNLLHTWSTVEVKYFVVDMLEKLPSAQPEIIRCKDCKFYSPMNRETKTGICNLIMHQNFGDNWFCAGAERRPDESNMRDK